MLDDDLLFAVDPKDDLDQTREYDLEVVVGIPGPVEVLTGTSNSARAVRLQLGELVVLKVGDR
jgi:hypothetical protein